MDERLRIPILLTAGFVLYLLMILVGCSGGNVRVIEFDTVGGDVWIRSIASDNQSSNEGSSVSGEVPIEGIDTKWNYLNKGLLSGSSVIIKNVSGCLYIEEAGNRNHNDSIPLILEKLFLPGDPFNYNKWEEVPTSNE